jgi:hypothetical protein
VPVKTLPITTGASGASAFIINGVPALSLIGMIQKNLTLLIMGDWIIWNT